MSLRLQKYLNNFSLDDVSYFCREQNENSEGVLMP